MKRRYFWAVFCLAAAFLMTACGKYQVSGVLEGGASQLAVVQLGNGGTERIDTLDCLGGAFAFDVDYDKPVTILITTWPGKASRPANSFA